MNDQGSALIEDQGHHLDRSPCGISADPQDTFWLIVLQPDLPVFTCRPRVLNVLRRQPVPERRWMEGQQHVNIVSRNVRRFHFSRPRMSSAPAVEREDVDLLFVMGRPFSLLELGRLEGQVSISPPV